MKKPPDLSRRKFLKQNSVAGLATVMGTGIGLSFSASPKPLNEENQGKSVLTIKPRYHRWYVDPGVEWLETNTGYATLDWTIPISQMALVLVDVWQRHYLKDTEARGEAIVTNTLAPLMNACRKAGLTIIHAPSPMVAKQLPNWSRQQAAGKRHQTGHPPNF